MTAQFRLIDPVVDGQKWDALLAHFPEATFFHTAAWAETLIRAYSFKPFYCAWIENNKPEIVFSIMQVTTLRGKRHGVLLPFSDFCPVLASGSANFTPFFEHIVRLGQDNGWEYLEMRGNAAVLADQPWYEQIATHDIDLRKGADDIFGSFRDSTKRNIRNAENSGVQTVHSSSMESLREFCRLNCLTRRSHGIPPQPWKFFRYLQENFLSREKGFITLAKWKRKTIAANIYLTNGTKAIYKYGASDSAYKQLRANNLVMWEGIKKCRGLGCHTINLGRTELHHRGLLQFKRGFGCAETSVNYYRYDIAGRVFIKGTLSAEKTTTLSRIIPHFPIPLLKLAGRILYKYAG